MDTLPGADKYQRLIHQQASKAFRKLPPGQTGIDYEDLVQEGLLVYSRFLKQFDPSRGYKFITGFYLCLWQSYGKLVRQAWRRPRLYQWDDSSEATTAFEDLLADRSVTVLIGGAGEVGYYKLSREAWMFVRAVLDPPKALERRFRRLPSAARVATQVIAFLGFDRQTADRVKREVVRSLQT